MDEKKPPLNHGGGFANVYAREGIMVFWSNAFISGRTIPHGR